MNRTNDSTPFPLPLALLPARAFPMDDLPPLLSTTHSLVLLSLDALLHDVNRVTVTV